MTVDDAPKSLSEITEDLGLNMSDVAAFSGLDESTIFRLWENPEWLDRASGRSLQSLMASVPGITEYAMEHSIRKRRNSLVTDLQSEGLVVDLRALERSTVAPQLLLNALEAALHIVRGGTVAKVSSYVARFWGREQDRALSALYSTEPGQGLLEDPHKLFESSIDLAPRLNGKTYSFHSILALNILTHQVSKVTGAQETELSFEVPGRQSAFMMKGVVMGELIRSNDIDLADRYQRALDRTPVYTALEEWALPTYSSDSRVSSDFTLPSSLVLRNTATEVLREIMSYSDAYFYYLVLTYIPLALRRDPTFGMKLPELITALQLRGAECEDRKVRDACNKLVTKLKGRV